LDNTAFWLGQSPDGAAIAIKLQGSSPVRVSTDAVEHAWSTYARRDDAQGYAYQDEGKSFWIVGFPSANNGHGATWCYEVSTGLWTERGRWDITRGEYGMDRSCCHAYAFGLHLVGDPLTGIVYRQSLDLHDDAGHPLRRMRRAPHLRNDGKTVFYSRFELEAETGVGESAAMLRWSNDAGRTFSDERRVSLGALGEYRTRAVWHRLGSARDRVFEVAISDAVPVALLGASIEATGGAS
jgi:hypothetical protein